jgi:carboxypeptidase Taq
MKPRAAYDELIRRTREEALLASCSELLGWDELTYMPRGGVDYRGDQMAFLAGLQHERATSPHLAELLDTLESSELVRDSLTSEAVNVREIRRVYQRMVRLPRTLIEELARITSRAQQEWTTAQQDNDFSHVQPWLERIVALKRSEAEALGPHDQVYDNLLEEFEPGARTQELAKLFGSLREELVPLVMAIGETRRRQKKDILHREFSIDRQQIFGEAVAAAVGFDFQRGRLDTTSHPFFSSIGPGDCRITTRYSTHNFSDSFFAILHEVGHGLYEQGLAPEHHGTPMGEAASLGLHESQARLWENLVGRSLPFWEHFFPRLKQIFHETLQDVRVDAFFRAINTVAPSCNRVRADEVTYNLHILIRFDLEQALMTGDLAVADLPSAWNAAYKKHLGVTPQGDLEGCLQDSHWAGGLFGYFPTYTLGNVFGAQLFVKAQEELGDLSKPFSRGDFAGLLDWLRQKVYSEGSRYTGAKLIEHITGSSPDHVPLVKMLRQKYSSIYRLQ